MRNTDPSKNHEIFPNGQPDSDDDQKIAAHAVY